jgi:uncharacterized protein
VPDARRAVRVAINQQQAQLLDRLVAEGLGTDHAEVLAHGLRSYHAEHPDRPSAGGGQKQPAPAKPPGRRAYRPVRSGAGILLEPGTGKAIEVPRGHVLRVEQVQGGQCADFNAFNLHDYREAFNSGRTRVQHGLFPTEGDVLWSAPPRERPMLTIVADTVGSNDISFPRCTALLFESAWGYEIHTNCQDILAEALREYGLTPDDVHDSFNMWMNTTVDPATGRLGIESNLSGAGDYIEMLAHFDILAAISVCGADLSRTSNFTLHPLRVFVREATAEELQRWSSTEMRRFKNQRTPADFRVRDIRSERKLSRDPAYTPRWPVYPIVTQDIVVELADREYAVVQQLAERENFGTAAGDVLRYLFFSWCAEHYMRPDPLTIETRLLAVPDAVRDARNAGHRAAPEPG